MTTKRGYSHQKDGDGRSRMTFPSRDWRFRCKNTIFKCYAVFTIRIARSLEPESAYTELLNIYPGKPQMAPFNRKKSRKQILHRPSRANKQIFLHSPLVRIVESVKRSGRPLGFLCKKRKSKDV